MDLVLQKSSKVNVKLDGVDYPLRSLKLREQREFIRKVQDAKDDMDVTIGLYIDLFKALGLPEEVIDEMDAEFVAKLAAAIMYPKKNSD